MPRPPFAVVVPTRNRPAMLRTCLAALVREVGPDDEVLVVDSASTLPDEVAAVAAEVGVRYVRQDVKGASRARNAGWRATERELVVFVDDDVQVLPGWADALLAPVADGVDFVVGRTVAPADFEGQAATVTWGRPDEVIDLTTTGAFAASNNLLLRRSALLRTGGFDERLGPGTWLEAGEDLELLDRVLALGAQGRYAHDAVGTHDQWRDARQLRRLQLSYGKGMGARFALMLRRDPRRARSQVNELLRLGGLVTLVRRALRRPAPAPATPALVEDGVVHEKDASGIAGPVLWRLGALLGLVVGLLVLRPSAVQVPVDHAQAAGLPPAANDA
jgi:glycosyltransferase involved in cell wall biosynthesis